MNLVAGLVLVLLVNVMFTNYWRGTLGQWFKAKFLNIAPGK